VQVRQLAFLFLVPRQGIGSQEFSSLAIEPGDKKAYITWYQVLGWLEEPSLGESAIEGWEGRTLDILTVQGALRVRALLADDDDGDDGPEVEKAYESLRELTKKIAARVRRRSISLGFSRIVKSRPWYDKRRGFGQVVFQLEETKGRAVYVTMRTKLPESAVAGSTLVTGQVSFQIENSAAPVIKKVCLSGLAGLNEEPVAKVIQTVLPRGEGWSLPTWGGVEASGQTQWVQQEIILPLADINGLAEVLADRTLSYLLIFRHLLEPQGGERKTSP
jgi:hypothetical protein